MINREPIFLRPAFQEKIWGGDNLYKEFDFSIPSNRTGEAWIISSHPNGESIVESPNSLKGIGLNDLYQNYPEIFGGNNSEVFPLLIKILDANKKLSVQVHPDDKYGMNHDRQLGKNECWYIVSAEPGAKIIYGHNAKTKREFKKLVTEEKWTELFREIPVKAGEFYDVPAGTIHGIGAGIVILETQQNSDTTYRVYDYDRKDDKGFKRELHIPQSLDVSNVPHVEPTLNIEKEKQSGGTITHYITNDYFSIYKWDVEDQLSIDLPSQYSLVTVLEGEGIIEINKVKTTVKKSDSFILPNGITNIVLKGNLELIKSNPN